MIEQGLAEVEIEGLPRRFIEAVGKERWVQQRGGDASL